MTALFESVLRISIEAALLVLLVLGARLIISRRPGFMLTVLYVLIAVRLAVPLAISSPLSIQNIWNVRHAPIETTDSNPATNAVSDAAGNSPAAISENSSYTATQLSQENHAFSDNSTSSPASAQQVNTPLSALDISAIIWIAGMAVFAGAMFTGNALFMRRIKRNREYDSPAFAALLTECKQTLHLKRNIRTVRASETGTAAVYGVFRPVLLISPSSFEALTEAQQRHVLLHELSHVRRRDNLVCAGATMLNVIHWFNPLVWIVFALMRRDIEVQCDAHVFRGLPSIERAKYAGTLLKLAGPMQTPRLAPALFISKANIKRRIVMVVKHRKRSALFTAIAMLLTVTVAVTGCTTAMKPTAEEISTTEPPQIQKTNATEIPDNYQPIGTYRLDYSQCADNKAIVSNIEKAVSMLNGIVFPVGEEIPLLNELGPITTENGWQNASWSSWKTVSDTNLLITQEDIDNIIGSAKEMQIGGGIDLVAIAICAAASSAELSISAGWAGETGDILTDGYFNLQNEKYKDDVYLSVSTENSQTVAEFYGIGETEPELMASFTLDNRDHISANRMVNIKIAADMINGIIIKPGEEISLNSLLGPRDAETAKIAGWQEAAGFISGGFGMQFGGGVCAVSTALYNAAIRAELEIVEFKHCTVPYDLVDGGLDVTVSTTGPDLKISNPYDCDVTIEATLDDVLLTVNIYGPPMDYTVDFHSEIGDANKEAPEMMYVYDTEIAPDGTKIAPGV
jgi:beta-lactamase regulating signal transducer with metallopeptidase domain/vancomycin resistance protein YoaR